MSSHRIGGFSRMPGVLAACWPTSLKYKQIALTLALCVAFIWAVAMLSASVLRSQIEGLLAEQQFTMVQHLAAELDSQLKSRLQGLSRVATHAPDQLDPAGLDAFLAERYGLHSIFPAGVAFIGLDGRILARYPRFPETRGTYLGDREYFRRVVATGQPYIDKPILGRVLKRPVLAVSVPVFDAAGQLRAVMTGMTDLTAPNFLASITSPTTAGGNEFLVISPKDDIIIAATDARWSMQAAPSRDSNAMYARFADGFDGSGIAVNEEGVRRLYSGQHVPTSDWMVLAHLPADLAFRPVQVMQEYVYTIAALLTLLAILAIGGLTRRSLAPLEDAEQAMRQMIGGQAPLAPLPVRRKDEVGRLIHSFNLLVDAIRASEAKLTLSQQRLRELSAHNETRLEEERRSIAREIHDELGQLLTALKMDCSLLRRKYPDDTYLQDKIDDMRSLLDNTLSVVRHVATNLRPPALDHGIIPAIEWLAEDFALRWEISCKLELDADDVFLDDVRSTALFRIIQESLTNIARHAQASEVTIALRRQGPVLQLRIRDDGQGFDPAEVARKRGFGLQGIRERAIAFEGNLKITSAPGAGTTLTVEIPL